RHPQEAIPFAQLTVFVSTTRDERPIQLHRADVERYDVEMVIGVNEQRRACDSHARETRSISGTISAVWNSTDDIRTASVVSSIARAVRAARSSTGCA